MALERKPIARKAAAWTGGITALTGLLATAVTFSEQIRGAFDFLPSRDDIAKVETKHDADVAEIVATNAQLAKWAKGSYTNTLPPRIKNLLVMRCKQPVIFSSPGSGLPELLADLRTEYKDMTGRDYPEGTCTEGVYCNSLGVCETQ